MDPITISACIAGATRAYNLVAKAVNAGREIEDTAQYIGKFFDSKEKILEIEKENQYGPKFLRGSSVEAQALEIQMAKHKTQQMEAQLREIIVLYGPGEAFYNEMMKTRRTIRAQRLAAAEARAKQKRLIIDGTLILLMTGATMGIIFWMVSLVAIWPMATPKLNDRSELTISIVWLLQIITVVAVATWGYASISERIDVNAQETRSLRGNQNNYVFPDIRKLEEELVELQKEVLILQTDLKYYKEN